MSENTHFFGRDDVETGVITDNIDIARCISTGRLLRQGYRRPDSGVFSGKSDQTHSIRVRLNVEGEARPLKSEGNWKLPGVNGS
jgi:hypothetical protein